MYIRTSTMFIETRNKPLHQTSKNNLAPDYSKSMLRWTVLCLCHRFIDGTMINRFKIKLNDETKKKTERNYSN